MESKFRQMRIILMYDLPFEEPEQVKEYNHFRKKIIRLGFYALQYSIYVKVIKNETNYKTLLRRIYDEIPTNGNIRMIKVTEKQYEDMLFLRGKKNMHEQLIGDKELVVFREKDEWIKVCFWLWRNHFWSRQI
ncbi:MAG: CRISPR-associated endonuclease Cas2 [Mycoplasmatales bacterium]